MRLAEMVLMSLSWRMLSMMAEYEASTSGARGSAGKVSIETRAAGVPTRGRSQASTYRPWRWCWVGPKQEQLGPAVEDAVPGSVTQRRAAPARGTKIVADASPRQPRSRRMQDAGCWTRDADGGLKRQRQRQRQRQCSGAHAKQLCSSSTLTLHVR